MHRKELNEIAENDDKPSFENTIAAHDRSGATLRRVANVFYNLCSSQNTPEVQMVQTEMAPLLSRHSSATYQVPGLKQPTRCDTQQSTVAFSRTPIPRFFPCRSGIRSGTTRTIVDDWSGCPDSVEAGQTAAQ